MRNFFCVLFLLFLSSCSGLNIFGPTLQSEMTRLNIDTVMIIKSEEIDEYPLWSPDSRFVAANVLGKWYKFDLRNVKLSAVEWKKRKIGFILNQSAISELSNDELEQFSLHSKNGGREILISSGEKIELKLSNFSTSLVLKKNNAQPAILWSSAIENCHSLSLSPDKKYVAYLCELSGLLMMKID